MAIFGLGKNKGRADPVAATGPVPEVADPAPEAAPEAAPVERRQTPRLCLGEGFRARFMVEDQLVVAAAVTDLCAGGCCLRMPVPQCQDLRKGVELAEFHFLHDDLPRGVLPARVTWVLGRAGADSGYCLVGVTFVQPPDGIVRAIAAYVARHVP